MTPSAQNLASTVGFILLAMAVVSAIEGIIPLRARGMWDRAHLVPNLALTFITMAIGALLNTGVVLVLLSFQAKGWGLLNALELDPVIATALVVLALDLAFYLAHVAMHKLPALWRFHRVHHSDPAIDVTTTIRQHPFENVFRYLAIVIVAAALGASPAAFAIYRTASALNGLLEHANWRVPQWLDSALSWVTTWPNLHKVHHSRAAAQTDSNYGNLFSWWDRVFSTFTPSREASSVEYGLDGYDAPEQQTTVGLLALPLSEAKRSERLRPVAAAER
jgi:sterol desaturase/sphingolipid hydroxylase (fatty acid hydroxylase superfamily)